MRQKPNVILEKLNKKEGTNKELRNKKMNDIERINGKMFSPSLSVIVLYVNGLNFQLKGKD